jgi:hypothetical protein
MGEAPLVDRQILRAKLYVPVLVRQTGFLRRDLAT